MRSYRTLIILAVVSVALAVPVCTTFAGGKPKAVVDTGILLPALDVFPGTKYDNIYTQQADDMGAAGTFDVDQPTSGKWVAILFWVEGLLPNTTYRAYIDQNGINESAPAGDCSTAGPCTLINTFTTDADGVAAWYYEAYPSPGTYQWSLFINRIIYTGPKLTTNNTVLISDNLDFTINP